MVNKFRDISPSRRKVPTKKPSKDWGLHKPDLKIDFNNHCGYCHSYDGFRHTYYEVDHFVPKDLIKKNKWTISLTEYGNLVYSCKFCNNKKLNQWPSNSSTVFKIRNKGFVDPCHVDYDSLFYRTVDGAIRTKNSLGKWMATVAFKFDERERSIIVLWNLNSLRQTIDALIIQIKKYPKTSVKYKAIESKLGKFALEYYKFHKELMEYYDG